MNGNSRMYVIVVDDFMLLTFSTSGITCIATTWVVVAIVDSSVVGIREQHIDNVLSIDDDDDDDDDEDSVVAEGGNLRNDGADGGGG